VWRRTIPKCGLVSLVSLTDSGVVALGATKTVSDSGEFATAIKYDLDGTEVWRRRWLRADEPDRPSGFHAGFEGVDSSLVLCGWIQRSDLLSKGILAKLNSEGEVEWGRVYSHYDVSSISLWQVFWDVKPTSDGGLVLTGEANGENYPYPQLWLLKLDSVGCLVPGCGSVGVEEYVEGLSPYLQLWPNPSDDRVSVSLNLPEGFTAQGAVQLYLVDAHGRIVLQQPARTNLNILSGMFDVTDLPRGMYYLHVADGKRWLVGSKVVVE
jgi:hypothetical protein